MRQIVNVLEQGARVALPVIAAVATAGVIAGVVSITGLGSKFAAGIIALSSGHLILWHCFSRWSLVLYSGWVYQRQQTT